jgi:hypothetical protein
VRLGLGALLTTVRKAMDALEADGLVVTFPMETSSPSETSRGAHLAHMASRNNP